MQDNVSMPMKRASSRGHSLFARNFQERVRALRNGAGLSQGDMADALGIAVDTYKKYESRTKSMLPQQHVPAFIKAINGGPEECYFLFTGKIHKHQARRAVLKKARA